MLMFSFLEEEEKWKRHNPSPERLNDLLFTDRSAEEASVGNYIEHVAYRIWHVAEEPDEGRTWSKCDKRLYLNYAVLCLTMGVKVTSEAVHDAWAAWQSVESSTHPSLVPFQYLAPVTQEKDDHYRDAIVSVASMIMKGSSL